MCFLFKLCWYFLDTFQNEPKADILKKEIVIFYICVHVRRTLIKTYLR